ncbi:transmembrane protein 230-like isoform X1 [Corticium candelabrum]|uniref:transmembrane protein 230-like isoform X1 n=1 Tax=Corticium candelabrum TaxID=121492 RepID=UPI002E26BB40|nr:transmembrane protein 230-like isoform X1 [Corticium candelabrum]
MSGRKGKYDYHRLREERTYTDAQFRKPAVKVPVKAIGLAVMLFLVGSVLLILGSLLATGVVGISDHWRGYTLIVIGSLTFIPGSYHSWLAYNTYMGRRGFSYSDIPSMD